MAWMENKLQNIDLLAAMELKRRRDEAERMRREQQTGDGGVDPLMQKAMMQEQLKAMQGKNKMADLQYGLLTSPFNRPNTPLDTGYSPGMGNYMNRQQDLQNLSMITGNQMPSMGIRSQDWGGGRSVEQPAPAPSAPAEWQGSGKPTSVDIAQQLGALYGPRGGSGTLVAQPQGPSLYEGLIEEEKNRRGLESLTDQAKILYGKKITPEGEQDIKSGASPITSEAKRGFQNLAENMPRTEDAKTVALNNATRDVTSFPGFGGLGRKQQNDLINNLESEMSAYWDYKSGTFRPIPWGEIINKYSQKKLDKK